MTTTDQRRVWIAATWPADVPQLGVTKGQTYDLSTATKIWFTAKAAITDDDSQAVIKKDTSLAGADDITISGATAYFDIVPADTAAFATIERAQEFVCEVQVKSAGGEVWTVAQGKLKLLPQVIQAST